MYSQKEISDAIIKKNVKPLRNESVRNNALALYMDLGLTRRKYQTLREFNKYNCVSNDKFPPYSAIFSAKNDCYPFNVQVSESSASVVVQEIIDLTIYLLILSFSDSEISKINNKELVLKCKWGMDGSSGQQNYKQNFKNKNLNDSSVFLIMFVPIEISVERDVIWVNERSNSPRLCRPLSFEFTKETSENTLRTYKYYANQLKNLKPSVFECVRGVSFSVKSFFQCSMVDGKTVNTLTGQRSTSSCNVCGAKPSVINNLTVVKSLECNENAYEFGLSPLHSRIRFMECILHIAYNLDFEKGYARGDDKALKSNRKQSIQNQLKEKLSLAVDVVKQSKL